MSSTINPNSLKIQLAYRFLHNLNNLNTKRSSLDNTHIHLRSHRVKIAAYASMAYVVGSRRAWSRSILCKIRNRALISRKKNRVVRKTTPSHLHHRVHDSSIRRRNPNFLNPSREYDNPIGDSGLEGKLRKLVPGSETMDSCGLLDETADYIKCLAIQVEVMKTLVDLYSTF